MPAPSLRSLVAAAVLPTALVCAAAAQQCEPRWQLGDPVRAVSGTVNTTMVWDPDGSGPATPVLLVAGRFHAGQMASTGLAAFDGTEWLPVGSLPPGEVTALGLFNAQLIAAVSATSGGQTVVRWDGSAWRALGDISGYQAATRVRAMAAFQGSLVVAGRFLSAGGVPALNIARWDGVAWTGLGGGVAGSARALAVFSNLLYVGGDLPGAGHLAAWTGSGWVPTAGMDGPVYALAARVGSSISNSYLFAGGDFVHVAAGTLRAHRVARYNGATNSWTAMGAGLSARCTALTVRATGLNSYEVVAGVRPPFYGDSVQRWTGSTWTAFSSVGVASDPTPTGLSYFGGRYVVGVQRSDAAVKTFDGASWRDVVGPGFDGPVHAVLGDRDDAVIGGSFRSIGGVTMNGVARGRSGAWSPLGTGLQFVFALARLPNGDLVAGGIFRTPGSASLDNIARWDGSSWLPLGTGVDGQVLSLLVLANGDLIAGGSFTTAGGVAANHIARWDGRVWAPVGGGAGGGTNGAVRALAALPNGDLAVGGDFTLAGGVTAIANRIARFDGRGWSPFGSGMDDAVLALAVMTNGDLMAGGRFTTAGGVAAVAAARWNGSSWAGTQTAPWSSEIRALAVLPNGDVVGGGQAGLGWSTRVARFDGATWSSLEVEGGTVDGLGTLPNGDLIAGGDFVTAGGVVSVNVARLTTPCPATAAPYGTACSGSAGPLTLAARDLPWVGGTYRASSTGIVAGAVVFDGIGFVAASIPLSSLHPTGAVGCDLLLSLDLTRLLTPANGVATAELSIPNNPALVAVVLHHQVLQVELGAGPAIRAVNASNGLRLTLGRF